MSPIKKLLSQTAVYGLTHTVGRVLNFLLVPLYTSDMVFSPEEYGVVNVLYSVVGFAIVLLTYGLETAFFNFSREQKSEKVLGTGLFSILGTSLLFIFLGTLFSGNVANFLEYPDRSNLINMLVFILALDALSALPLAYLRQQNRPMRFATVRLINIGVNIGLNLLFYLLFPALERSGMEIPFYDQSIGVGYVFISNLIASAVTFLLLIPEFRMISFRADMDLLRKMVRYGAPLIIVGLAGVVNETLDRILLKKLLPSETADFDVGVYGAFYKLSIIITIFIQAFRYGAEPFFFEHSKSDDPKPVYAKVMRYFVVVSGLIMLSTIVFLKQIAPFIVTGSKFYQHPHALTIVPFLLLANVFLGINFNLNIWYKLQDRNRIGAYISIGGALITIVMNLMLIPVIGILGSAITTLVVYFTMAVASYYMGRKYYPIPYNLRAIGFYLTMALVLSVLHLKISAWISESWSIIIAIMLVLTYAGLAWGIERPDKKL